MTEKSLRILIVIFGLSFCYSALRWSNDEIELKKQKEQILILNSKLDSLHDENFNNSVMNGRYELSIEYLKEINPKAAKQLTDYLEKETE